ncbi:hypothetical protein RRG08_013724 [Elysia crispata]|uniref:Uncharacterized protein n=1 Tax=Elysia crispata TaxID=231223 RepID=A0AAE0ZPR9_9GAST|nr:hypothetical protein RRG08_013724 [Elysia crispata]
MLKDLLLIAASRVTARQPGASQKMPDVIARTMPGDAISLGFTTSLSKPTPAVSFSAIADTEWQSCLASVQLLHKMAH